ncbi:glycosyltransferase family 4 protein [Streptosporangiaceae bacterium NEAU-GS5]|nr:glycosyltransferase family 4 protein [Streptosporangiaceae bacterium NEAU-GS5]
MADRLRVALLSYRSKPTCGGQGVYLRHISRELIALGHHVEVFSGQPYPELDEGVVLNKVPSLDLYRDEDPFRTPKPGEYRDWIDALEVATMWTAGFPEPLTFSLRARRELRKRVGDFDVVQDNQTLGYGVLGIAKHFPVVGTIHHPISVDRRIELEAAKGWKKLSMRRWYGFVRMQAYVAPRLNPILTVSESSLADIHRDFHVPEANMRLVPLGVDTRFFHPRPELPKRPGSIVAVASADSPMKGVATLLRAVAKLATEREVNVTVVSRPTPGGPTEKLVAELSLHDKVTFTHGISDTELATLIATSEVSVVPSLYEGFSLPAVEHMACGTPLVASRTGALPEVVGDAAVQVAPGDAEELAAVLRRLLDSPQERAEVGRQGYDRVMERYAWPVVARKTVEAYQEAIRRFRADR